MASDDEFELSCYGNVCSRVSKLSSALPFDPTSIQNIILTLSDKFDFRVVMSSGRVYGAVLMTTGLALAGSMLGKRYGGRLGAAVGGAVGGACGVGIAAVALRDIWEEVKPQLSELFELVYDYVAGLGVADYQAALAHLLASSADSQQLALLLLNGASSLLDKNIISTLTSASTTKPKEISSSDSSDTDNQTV